MTADEASFQMTSMVWCKAFTAAIDIIRTIKSSMEEGRMPTPCGICALNLAVETLEGINKRQIEVHANGPDAAMLMLEAKGNA